MSTNLARLMDCSISKNIPARGITHIREDKNFNAVAFNKDDGDGEKGGGGIDRREGEKGRSGRDR